MPEAALNFDAYAPAEMARRVETVGVKKAHLGMAILFALAVLAGAFISLGANFATVVWTDNGLSYGLSRLLSGLVFSLGLILVIVGGGLMVAAVYWFVYLRGTSSHPLVPLLYRQKNRETRHSARPVQGSRCKLDSASGPYCDEYTCSFRHQSLGNGQCCRSCLARIQCSRAIGSFKGASRIKWY